MVLVFDGISVFLLHAMMSPALKKKVLTGDGCYWHAHCTMPNSSYVLPTNTFGLSAAVPRTDWTSVARSHSVMPSHQPEAKCMTPEHEQNYFTSSN